MPKSGIKIWDHLQLRPESKEYLTKLLTQTHTHTHTHSLLNKQSDNSKDNDDDQYDGKIMMDEDKTDQSSS